MAFRNTYVTGVGRENGSGKTEIASLNCLLSIQVSCEFVRDSRQDATTVVLR